MGEWILSPASELTSRQLGEGVAALDAALHGGPQKAIAAAIMEMIGATDRPPQLDKAGEAARVLALQQMAWDYPVSVVLLACRNWRKVPNYGRWWPTEQDLRAQCEPLVEPQRSLRNKARALQMQLEAAEEREARMRGVGEASPFANDAGREFRNLMRKRMTPARFEAYFHPSEASFVGANEIICRSQTAARVLSEEGGDIAERLGLRIRYRPEAFLHIRIPSWEDDTPEERAEVERKFNRLKLAMANGEDIKRLRREGVL